jgi:hypothetical protein
MILIVLAAILGGSIAFALLLPLFGIVTALLGAHVIGSVAALAAGFLLACDWTVSPSTGTHQTISDIT